MFKKILLAYDGSPSSTSALHTAADIADRYSAKLHLLAIVHTAGVIAFDELAVDDTWGMEKDHLEQAMNLAAIELGQQGLDIVTETGVGDPVRRIIACVERINADLVVVGHTDKGVFARWFESSVGSGLLAHLPCPLLITPQDA